jgi:FkbM family methyltransferase
MEINYAQVALLGTGELGRRVMNSGAKKHVVAVVDNNTSAQGSQLGGLVVTSVEEAISKFGPELTFVVAIYNNLGPIETLKAKGCKNVVSYIDFFRHYAGDLLPHAGLEKLGIDDSETEAIAATLQIWHDDKSRTEYIKQIDFRRSGSALLPRENDPANTYFDSSVYKILRNERFVDCGAFDGDAIRALTEHIGAFPEFVHAFEPDPANLAILNDYATGNTAITVHNCALGSSPGTMKFTAQGDVASKVSASGDHTVRIYTLDSVLSDFHPTLIKMDIEGSEADAIVGATAIIKFDAPVLAICLYHKLSDIWRIPALVHSINPDYKLYLRRYAQDCWETVLYAVPSDRLIESA